MWRHCILNISSKILFSKLLIYKKNTVSKRRKTAKCHVSFNSPESINQPKIPTNEAGSLSYHTTNPSVKTKEFKKESIKIKPSFYLTVPAPGIITRRHRVNAGAYWWRRHALTRALVSFFYARWRCLFSGSWWVISRIGIEK